MIEQQLQFKRLALRSALIRAIRKVGQRVTQHIFETDLIQRNITEARNTGRPVFCPAVQWNSIYFIYTVLECLLVTLKKKEATKIINIKSTVVTLRDNQWYKAWLLPSG